MKALFASTLLVFAFSAANADDVKVFGKEDVEKAVNSAPVNLATGIKGGFQEAICTAVKDGDNIRIDVDQKRLKIDTQTYEISGQSLFLPVTAGFILRDMEAAGCEVNDDAVQDRLENDPMIQKAE